jgi:hypothetical protein
VKQSAWLGILGLLLMASLGGGAPLQPRKVEKADVDPFGRTSFIERFEKAKRAGVIVIGDGQTYLGIYVFDRWGNCVAKDDRSVSSAARDDLAVEWFPPEIASYTIEVCNFGRFTNEFTIAIQ